MKKIGIVVRAVNRLLMVSSTHAEAVEYTPKSLNTPPIK